MIGWIKLHRKTTEHWIWSDPVKFQWWVRMLMEVNHTEKEILIGNTLYLIEKGQSGKSLRTWSTLFCVGTKAVVNFFELLEKSDMITKKTIGKGKHSTTLITITNYKEYQGNEETLKATQGTTQGTTKGTTQRTTQGKHEGHTNKNEKEIINNEIEIINNEKEEDTPKGVVDLKNQPISTKINFDELLSFFNTNRGLLPEVKKLSDTRKKRIQTLEKQYGKKSIQIVIEKVRDSSFLQGDNKENWTATFDWIFKPANFLKILEDNYATRQNTRSINSSATDAQHKQSAVNAVNAMFGRGFNYDNVNRKPKFNINQ